MTHEVHVVAGEVCPTCTSHYYAPEGNRSSSKHGFRAWQMPSPSTGSAPHSDALFWVAGIVPAFIVPICLILAAVFVSSWGIPLPFYVAVP